VPTPNLFPAVWKPFNPGTLISIDHDPEDMDADPDKELECLIIYRHSADGVSGPLGGIVFEPRPSQSGGGDLVSARLLPWINSSYSITATLPGSFPGYLGTLGEKRVDVRVYETTGDSEPDELALLGLDYTDNYTTLSLYRWLNRSDGYQLLGYFHGNTMVEIVDAIPRLGESIFYTGTVRTIRTHDRIYDRSDLRMVYQYDRKADGSGFEYRSNWVNFAPGAPIACLYPEARALEYFKQQGRPVFDLRLYAENSNPGQATVCAGNWEMLSATDWRRHISMLTLKKVAKTDVNACDEWIVDGSERILPGRLTCDPP
jgi:hypothetical protein